MPKLRFARSDKRCRCCGRIVVHRLTSYDLEHHYHDERDRLYCSKRCLLKKTREEDVEHL
jgi:hypothetical protein